MAKSNDKMVANNKKAYHDYFILDKIETGIALHGTEVKSLRMGKMQYQRTLFVLKMEKFLSMVCISVHMRREISLTKIRSESESCFFTNQRSTN